MFELIGLAFATLFLFAIAAAIGCAFAFGVWRVVRNRQTRRWMYVSTAFAIPVASAAYLWICIALLPGKSLFGDISEKLPNGYALIGLGKMPDFSSIERADGNRVQTKPSQCIKGLQVLDALVVGEYSHPFGDFEPVPGNHFFAFNTQADTLRDFKTQSELENFVGHTVNLTEPQLFKSVEPSAIRQRRINTIIMIGPPIFLTILYVIWLLRIRHGEPASSQSSYSPDN